jgi:uncharacterized protein
MGGWDAKVALRGVAATVTALVVAWLALWYLIPAPPSTITIGAGVQDGAYEHIAVRYRERLARHHVKVEIQHARGSVETAKLLSDPTSGLDAGILLVGIADSATSPDLVSLGSIAYAPIWFFSRSAAPVEHFSQFKGKRVSLNFASGRIVNKILAAYGVTPANTTFVKFVSVDAIKALLSGEADVISFAGDVNSPNIQALLHDPAIHVMNVTEADALTQLFPSLNHLVLSRGVVDLEKTIPSSDVNLIALTDTVVARANLHPEMIYLLAQTMKDEHTGGGIFHKAGDFPTQTDPALPMAEEALDYYRNGPSFLQRYLPFWTVNYAKRLVAVLLATFAVVIPLFTYAPKIYQWFLNAYLKKLYGRLRSIEAKLAGQLTAPDVEALYGDLEATSRAARIIPMRHSDLFFSLILHIEAIRARLAARLADLARDPKQV